MSIFGRVLVYYLGFSIDGVKGQRVKKGEKYQIKWEKVEISGKRWKIMIGPRFHGSTFQKPPFSYYC